MSSNIGQATSISIIKINTAELNCISSQGTKKKESLLSYLSTNTFISSALYFSLRLACDIRLTSITKFPL